MTDSRSNTTAKKPTKRMLDLLKWAAVAGVHRTWPIEFSIMHRKARDLGYIDRCHDDLGRGIGLTAWKITEGGKELLRAER